MRTTCTISAVVAMAALTGGCLQILGYEDPVHAVPDGGTGAAGSTSSSSVSSSSSMQQHCTVPADGAAR